MEIILVDEEEILQKFLENTIPQNFRYFEKRNLNCIKNHLVTYLGYLENKPIAYGHLDKEDNNVWLGLCILENQQGMGFGKEMLKYLIDFSDKNLIKEIKLTVDIDNFKALNLYLKHGFKISEINKKHYLMERKSSIINIPVSLGEALDKLTILDIKLEKIKDDRRKDVEYEYDLLTKELSNYIEDNKFNYRILKEINLNIWDMQDDFRYNKGDKNELCIKIIEENDRRFRVKKKINEKTKSCIKEQKGYKIKEAFVLTHLGLGDNITSIGMVRYLSTLYDRVNVVCKERNEENVRLFYEDDKNITIYPVKNDNNISPRLGCDLKTFEQITKNMDLYLCGAHNMTRCKKITYDNIPYCFYQHVDISPKIFWEYFYIPSIVKSRSLLDLLNGIDFIFIHNTSSQGKVFDINIVEKKLTFNRDDILFLNPCINCYDVNHKFYQLAENLKGHKLAEYKDIIENSEANIFSDSSFMCLSLNLDIKTKQNYFVSRGSDYSKLYDSVYYSETYNKRKFKPL